MSEANNETPVGASPLRVGLIADADEAPALAEALKTCPELELSVQGGMPQTAGLPDVQWYDDARVLVVQGEIDALVIGTSPRVGVTMGEVAAAHNVHVWRPPPMGRNFAEAVEVARRMPAVSVVYRIASWWEHVESEIRWAIGLQQDFRPVFSELVVRTEGPPLQSWRSSQVDAGGGVLTHDAYAVLEALTALRGLPESVSGAIGKCRRRPEEAPRETEDVASAIYRYDGGGLAGVHATWDIRPFEKATSHHGPDASVRYSESSVSVSAADGKLLQERALPDGILAAEMARFAAEIADHRQGESNNLGVDRHLAVSALLEATYLSSRTGQPETPRRLFEVQKWPEPKC